MSVEIGAFSGEGAALHFRSPGDVAQGVCAFGELFFDGEACVIQLVLGFQAADAHAVGPEGLAVLND
ncbi:hypothetical protein J41TS2_00350 [Bacillus sonorensis]|nr:hypothetical protein J41TS2_00350 [Bacillus sonorensis]